MGRGGEMTDDVAFLRAREQQSRKALKELRASMRSRIDKANADVLGERNGTVQRVALGAAVGHGGQIEHAEGHAELGGGGRVWCHHAVPNAAGTVWCSRRADQASAPGGSSASTG